ncbi:Peptidase A1 domain-containing protein [Mycena kentingensis (nom. inval.)]|nr:Peptidase A1 domain-containing protein [Mycena kentingensis (nom. inval.)]
MDAFTYLIPTKSEEPTLPPVSEDSSSGSSGSCVVCRTDTSDLPPVDQDSTEIAFMAWRMNGNPMTRLVLDERLDSPMFSVTLQRDTVDMSGNEAMPSIGGLPEGVDNSSLTWVPIRKYPTALAGSADSPAERYAVAWEVFVDDVYLAGVVLPRSALTPSSIPM